MKEWRVVSKAVFGTFKCFDSEDAARKFYEGYTKETANGPQWIGPGMLANDPNGIYRLESRPVGSGPSDWKEATT